MQGQINYWQTGQMPGGLALLGASLLNVKTSLCCFFMFLDCSPRVKYAEILIAASSICCVG